MDERGQRLAGEVVVASPEEPAPLTVDVADGAARVGDDVRFRRAVEHLHVPLVLAVGRFARLEEGIALLAEFFEAGFELGDGFSQDDERLVRARESRHAG